MAQIRGACFEVHARYMLDNPHTPFMLIHGIVTGQGSLDGKRFPHCWLVYDDVVYNFSIGADEPDMFPVTLFNHLGQVTPTVEGSFFEYDQATLRLKLLEHEHWGSWDIDLSQCDVH